MNFYKNNLSTQYDFEKAVAVAYIYLLPVRMLAMFSILRNALPGGALYLDFLLHAVGLSFIFFRRPQADNRMDSIEEQNVLSFVKLIIYLNCSSIFMALIIQLTMGDHGGENAFSGIAGMLIYFSQYALMFVYNKRVFELVSKEFLDKIFSRLCWILLFLGYWQVACMTIGGVFSTSYDIFNFLGVLHGSNMPKLCLTDSEGASAGSLISILVMPYLLSKIITSDNYRKYLIQIALWMIPLFFTKSSTGYILFSVCCAVFLFLMLRNHKFSRLCFLAFLLAVIAIIFLIFPELLPDWVQEQINYLLFEKAGDQNNGSTTSRMIPLLSNWGAFTEWPLFGVGNGLQGYFYEKYFPEWAFHVPGSDVITFLERSRTGIGNGGIFIPSLLSGYGIVGCTMILFFIKKYAKMFQGKKLELGNWYYMVIIASAAIFVSGFQGDFYGKYYLWFILCLPLIPTQTSSKDIKNA